MVDDPFKTAADNIRQELAAAESRILQIVEGYFTKTCARRGEVSGRDDTAMVDLARRIVATRRIRRAHFPAELFHERAWDMLLELFIAHTTSRDVWVKSLLGAADGSPTTAMRWLDHLEASGLLLRRTDHEDRRRVIVNLTEKGEAAMLAYLQDANSIM